MSTSAGSSAASGVAHGELENEPDSVNAGKKGPLKIAPHPKGYPMIQTIYSQGEVPFSVSNGHSDVTFASRPPIVWLCVGCGYVIATLVTLVLLGGV